MGGIQQGSTVLDVSLLLVPSRAPGSGARVAN